MLHPPALDGRHTRRPPLAASPENRPQRLARGTALQAAGDVAFESRASSGVQLVLEVAAQEPNGVRTPTRRPLRSRLEQRGQRLPQGGAGSVQPRLHGALADPE